MHITGLYTYPVKSLTGFSLKSADLLRPGIKFDRQWMLVEPDGTFITQRTCPQAALINTAIADGALVLSTFGMEDITVEPPSENTHRMVTHIWGDRVNALVLDGSVSEWLSDAVGTKCKLVYFPAWEKRQCDLQFVAKGDHTYFADGFPLLLVSQSSLDDLNRRLVHTVGIERFRPNIVVNGCEPFEEDIWRNLQINGLSLRFAKHCSRCSVPTINPSTGMLEGPEPIHTLSGFRKRDDGKVYFGVNLIPESTGVLTVGDTVQVIQ